MDAGGRAAPACRRQVGNKRPRNPGRRRPDYNRDGNSAFIVITTCPRQPGIDSVNDWIPAFAGKTTTPGCISRRRKTAGRNKGKLRSPVIRHSSASLPTGCSPAWTRAVEPRLPAAGRSGTSGRGIRGDGARIIIETEIAPLLSLPPFAGKTTTPGCISRGRKTAGRNKGKLRRPVIRHSSASWNPGRRRRDGKWMPALVKIQIST